MRRKLICWILLLLVAIIPFTSVTAEPTVSTSNPLSLSATTLDSKPLDSSIFRNYDLIMVNYWAEWCGPCVGELPDLQKIHTNYPNVLVLGAYVGSNVSGALSAAKNAGVTYPLFTVSYDLYDYIQRSGGSFPIPQTCFFNNEGYQLNSAYIGSRNYSAWAAIVDEMLAYTGTQEPEIKEPKILTHPKSVKVKEGKKVTFKVKAEGEQLKYQWYYRTSSNAKWKKVSNATKASYSFKAKAKHNGYQFRCLVKNPTGKGYSKAATLKIKTTP